jgi:plasmid stabilization system protein ParE
MRGFSVSNAAEHDLADIYAHWARRAAPESAARLIDAIVDRFWLIGEYPESGRDCDECGKGAKCFPAGTYLIFYRKARSGVVIARVVGGQVRMTP